MGNAIRNVKELRVFLICTIAISVHLDAHILGSQMAFVNRFVKWKNAILMGVIALGMMIIVRPDVRIEILEMENVNMNAILKLVILTGRTAKTELIPILTVP